MKTSNEKLSSFGETEDLLTRTIMTHLWQRPAGPRDFTALTLNEADESP
jgi:hypothetical protein